jgi:hypothetical protein
MRFSRFLAVSMLCMQSYLVYAGSVFVSEFFDGGLTLSEHIAASTFKISPIGRYSSGDKFFIQIQVKNSAFNDIGACVLSEAEVQSYRSGTPCHGYPKKATPFVMQGAFPESDNYYLALDNGYANFIPKEVTATIRFRKFLPKEVLEGFRRDLIGAQTGMQKMFENSDFGISIKPCGQINAFSDSLTADITLCSEMIFELGEGRAPGVLAAVLLHEFGHSLLNRWGEPGSSEEDMADEFATAILLRTGERGKKILNEWIAYWRQRDSEMEARNQLTQDDPHSLSIQRARNIQRNMNGSQEFIRRWNKMLYRHMTKQELRNVIRSPGPLDSVGLAEHALNASP